MAAEKVAIKGVIPRVVFKKHGPKMFEVYHLLYQKLKTLSETRALPD